MQPSTRSTVPVLLGVLGLIPFVAGAAVAAVLPQWYAPLASYGVFVYALVILAFLGGVHWGRALSSGRVALFVWSVIPSLLGFFAAWLHRPLALGVLSAAFVFVGLYDVATFRREGPRWYAALRLWLTVIVAACLAVTAFAVADLRVDPFGTVVSSPAG